MILGWSCNFTGDGLWVFRSAAFFDSSRLSVGYLRKCRRKFISESLLAPFSHLTGTRGVTKTAHMLMTEHEGKNLLRAAGVPTPAGWLVERPEEILRSSFTYPAAVKAQVRGGGRGKSGGIVRVEDPQSAAEAAGRILEMDFGGERPSAVLMESWLEIERELYLSAAVDGGAGGYMLLYSPAGGVDVEGAPPPVRYPVGLPRNFRVHEFRGLLSPLEGDSSVREKVLRIARSLLRVAWAHDCTTVEINPFAVLAGGSLMAVDAKIVRDDSAAFRDFEIAEAIRASNSREPKPVERCLAAGLMLIPMEGNVGLISGGAGMTMATMDLIQAAGGSPACFLDCSANPTPEGYRLAFEMLDGDPGVRSILVSIFGGATQMDRVARVIRDIMNDRESAKAVVFRLNGTNAGAVQGIFDNLGIRNHATLDAAVAEAVSLAGPSA